MMGTVQVQMTQKMMVFVKSVEGVLKTTARVLNHHGWAVTPVINGFIINALNLVISLKDFGPASIVHNFEIYLHRVYYNLMVFCSKIYLHKV